MRTATVNGVSIRVKLHNKKSTTTTNTIGFQKWFLPTESMIGSIDFRFSSL